MAKTREIKGRIKAVKNIQRITKTMQMIATARYQSALRRATASKPYAGKIAELVGELAGRVGESVSHPLLRRVTAENATGHERLLVITSNRGLCGSYNANVLRTALQHLREHEDITYHIDLVGKKSQAFFRFNDVTVERFHSHIGDRAEYRDVERLAEGYMQEFSDGEVDAVRVACTEYVSATKQTPRVLKLLPLEDPTAQAEGESAAEGEVVYDFSPDPQTLLGELLPITVKTQLFQCFNEAEVSEQISRMVAMKAATDAAGKMGKSLRRDYNRARQAAITTELTEIIGGAAALE